MALRHTGGTQTPSVAVVTGANRGIGYEVVRQLADRGDHHVVLGSRDLDTGKSAAQRIDPGGRRVTAVQLDVADDASVAAMADWVTRNLGRTDVVVNNRRLLPGRQAPALVTAGRTADTRFRSPSAAPAPPASTPPAATAATL
ncbi:SDR family NAD(P)-dependent oxidoreductase [Streptomyces sp. NPDC002928]|uniref:SDR family NAD(P)-dependent oxidoreductase n=1 Tax=Streptomyces sp. NPDC002928 TaxID=3154440 RepID=UPI0033A6E3FA